MQFPPMARQHFSFRIIHNFCFMLSFQPNFLLCWLSGIKPWKWSRHNMCWDPFSKIYRAMPHLSGLRPRHNPPIPTQLAGPYSTPSIVSHTYSPPPPSSIQFYSPISIHCCFPDLGFHLSSSWEPPPPPAISIGVILPKNGPFPFYPWGLMVKEKHGFGGHLSGQPIWSRCGHLYLKTLQNSQKGMPKGEWVHILGKRKRREESRNHTRGEGRKTPKVEEED